MTSLMLAALMSISSTAIQSTAVDEQNAVKNEIRTSQIDSATTFVQWHNNSYPLTKDEDSMQIFADYDVDEEEAGRSLDVYIQEETISYEELIPASDAIESGISLDNVGDTKTEEYLHNKGYIKFTTTAYALGFYDGHIVYHIDVKTEQQKKFVINHKDNLIIRHGDNAATYTDDEYPASGTRYTPCTIYMAYSSNPITADEHESLSPDYSCSEAGVYYTFTAGGSTTVGDTATVIYGNTVVEGDYYMVATDTTEVQPVYVHNYHWLVDSVSISFKGVGVSISTGPNTDVMEGKTMTLKGYNNRVKRSTYSVNPEDWGFEQRYYFLNEGIKISTLNVDDFTIDTKRLRCGYIEEQYVNLSPNRYDAGDAYLELHFNKPIYEFSTNLSFWSSSEWLYSSSGDYAYLQYLSAGNTWKTYVDLLSVGLPTDRTQQKHFECDFIEGTYGIKFIAHKETPNTNRNKGRICIGNARFSSLTID